MVIPRRDTYESRGNGGPGRRSLINHSAATLLRSLPKSTQPDPTEQTESTRGSLELPDDNSALHTKGSQAADLGCRAPQAHDNQWLPSSVPASADGALPDGSRGPAAPSAAGSAVSGLTVPPSPLQPATGWCAATGSSAQPTTSGCHPHSAGMHSAPGDDAAASALRAADGTADSTAVR